MANWQSCFREMKFSVQATKLGCSYMGQSHAVQHTICSLRYAVCGLKTAAARNLFSLVPPVPGKIQNKNMLNHVLTNAA
jgi:hypothetical protein